MAVVLKHETSVLAFPREKPLRERLRAICSDLVAAWRADGGPSSIERTRAGLEEEAKKVCRRAGVGEEMVGWTMVAIVSEFWRDRLSGAESGSRVVLLPDCPAGRPPQASGVPAVCGPACEVATLWSAARDGGWTVLPTSGALQAIGGLLTGQFSGILGLAGLEDLKKAFAMIPCFSLPIAAVPLPPAAPVPRTVPDAAGGCPAGIDVDTALGFLGVCGGAGSPVADYLPVLREAAAMFEPASLAGLLEGVEGPGERPSNGSPAGRSIDPLDAAASMSTSFLARGGKFLRPFICLAAYDAVLADRASAGESPAADRRSARAAAVAIEIFHKASLVHDDIEDDDAMRYGMPTLHRLHGVSSAINAGDYMLGLGYRVIAGLARGAQDPSLVADLLRILSDAHVRLARGQGAEIWWRDAADKRLSVRQAIEIYALKTSPAFEAAISMGIRLAGRLPQECGAVDRYTRHVGTAFQVLNDLKDWGGDRENQRAAAGDLLGGRPTAILALALERLDREACDRLLSLASGSHGAEDGIAEASALFERADVFGRARDLVESERRLAVAAISTCRLPRLREVMEFLLELAVPARASSDCGRD